MNKLSRIINEEVNRFEGWFGGHDEQLTPREEKFVDEFSKLSNDQLRDILAKIDKQGNDNYAAASRDFNYYQSEEAQDLYAKENLIKKLIERRYWETKKKLFFGQPFLGSKIIFISTPDYNEDERQRKILTIYMANDTVFEYNFGYNDFSWESDIESDTSGDYKSYGSQTLSHKVDPSKAILTTKEVGLLNKIVRYNNLKFNKIPLVSANVTTKDAAAPVMPEMSDADFQWLIGLGSDKNKITKISADSNINEYGGFATLYMYVGESWDSETYSYTVWYNEHYKITKEEFKTNYVMSRSEAKEVQILEAGLYEPMIKAIAQINPKSKYLTKIRRYTR